MTTYTQQKVLQTFSAETSQSNVARTIATCELVYCNKYIMRFIHIAISNGFE